MNYKARKLNRDEFDSWNRFVDEHPEGTIFHKTVWLNLIDPLVEIYSVWMNDEIKAGVALIKTTKNGVTGFHIPPYTQYFSPLYAYVPGKKRSLTEEHECIRVLLEEVKDAKQIDFKLPRGHQSILPYHWKGFESTVRITHIVTGSLESYLKELNKNKARELKKISGLAEAGEIIVEDNISEADLRHLLKQTSERKGFDAQDAVAINLVINSDISFAKKVVIRSREHGLLAFGFFPFDNKAVYNLINLSIRVTDPVLKTVNLLLLYKAIEFALNNKKIFDFEGSMLPGVESFCRLMGGIQAPIYRVQKSSSIRYSLLRAANQIKNDRKKA